MELKNFFALDDDGNVLPNATCYLYERGTENLVPLLRAANGTILANPFSSAADGLVQFAAPNGYYDLRVVSGARDSRLVMQCNDVNDTLKLAEKAASRAELARDAAQLTSGTHESTAVGMQKTDDGAFFSVPVADSDVVLTLYQRVGNQAVKWGSYPSAESIAMLDSLRVNAGKVYPLRQMTRNGITSPEPVTFSKAILSITIIGARPGKFYRLAYYVNGNIGIAPGTKADGWIIEEVDQANYATAPNVATRIIEIFDPATPGITRDGIQTVLLASTVVTDLRVLITLDTAELPPYGTEIRSNSVGQSGYSYIIDPSRYTPAQNSGGGSAINSININSGQIAPFRSTTRGGGVSTPNTLQTMVILHARVINAKRGKFYGLRYFQNGNALVVPAADNWIIEEVDIDGYNASVITTANSIATLQDAQPTIDRTLGIQTILLKTKSDVRVEVTLDASKLAAYGTQYGMNYTPQNGYSQIIDPAFYVFPVDSSTTTPSTPPISPITYSVDTSKKVTMNWSDGAGSRGFVFGPNGANNLPNFVQVLKDAGVISGFATDWLPPITFEAAANGDGRTTLEFTGGNHKVDEKKTALNVSFLIEADGVALKEGDTGTAHKMTFRIINKLMANNTVSVDRYALLQSFHMDLVPGFANVHADYLALEDLQLYIDYGCQIVTTAVNDKLFYVGGQFESPIDWDGKVMSGNPIDYPNAWAVITTSANGQLAAWMDRDYGIAQSRQIDPIRGLIRGGGDASTKQYTTAYNKSLLRNPPTPNYIELAAGKRYQWRGGYSWSSVKVADGFVSSFNYLENGVIRRADAVSGPMYLKP